MKNKGFTVIELIVSFAITMIVVVFLFQMIISLKDIYVSSGIKSQLLNKQTIISSKINSDLKNKQIKIVLKCGYNCINFVFENDSSSKLIIDNKNGLLTYNEYTTKIIPGSSFGEYDIYKNTVLNVTEGDNDSVIVIKIPIVNTLLDGDYGVNIVYQYDSRTSSISDVNFNEDPSVESKIFLKGASNMDYPADIPWVYPGYFVIKPDGTIVENDPLLIIDGAVGTDVGTTYYLTYTLKDDSENVLDTKVRSVTIVETPYIDASGANTPELSTNMIPIVRDENDIKWVKAKLNSNWYEYDNQKWANVVLVKEAVRESYIVAEPGTDILEADVMAYLVWVPRYRYKLFNITSATITPQIIEIAFENKDNIKSTGSVDDEWLTHPAFSIGTIELSGLWVGKFETTGTALIPTIKPNLVSLRSQTISTQFITVQLFNNASTYGLTITNDSHMMKNTEWGAVAYLTMSNYGKFGDATYDDINKELYMNNSSSYKTGSSMGAPGGLGILTSGSEYINNGYYTYDAKCAKIDVSLPAPCNTGSTGQELPDKTLAYGASTTGNIYGVYDISGGAREYVIGMYKPNPILETGIIDVSGYSSTTTNSQYDLLDIDSRYFNQYLTSSYTTGLILGDATGETSGWYNDKATFVGASCPWFYRGGYARDKTASGGRYFSCSTGKADATVSFRTVIIP